MKQILIQEKTFDKAKKLVRETKTKSPEAEIIFTSNDDELNRKILEKEKIKVLLINLSERKDKMKQRDSGLNHVLAKIAKKGNVTMGINIDEILQAKTSKDKAGILSRVSQNIKLCSKNKLNMTFISPQGKTEKDSYDLKALGLSLGMPTWMTKDF